LALRCGRSVTGPTVKAPGRRSRTLSVIKKWLSYREHGVLGRALRPDEVGYVQEIARRIAAILLLGPALDACYAACKANPYLWPRT
jgi:hypothetical protein